MDISKLTTVSPEEFEISNIFLDISTLKNDVIILS
jgi:hypothetical protein